MSTKMALFALFNYVSFFVFALTSAITYLPNISSVFHDFPGLENEILKFHDFPDFP